MLENDKMEKEEKMMKKRKSEDGKPAGDHRGGGER